MTERVYLATEESAWLLPSGSDDTAAINAANANGQLLGPGAFFIAGAINSCPRGQGSGLTIIQATAAAARILHGPDPIAGGSNTINGPGVYGDYGGFTLNGGSIAGTDSNPLFTSNVVHATYRDIRCVNSAGSGYAIYGQNCVSIGVFTGSHASSALVLDYGAGNNSFYGCHPNKSLVHITIRQTAANTGGFRWCPQYNKFYGCFDDSTGTDQLALHVTNGLFNYFEKHGFVPGTLGTALFEQGLPYGFPNFNCRTYFRDCTIGGTSVATPGITSGTSALYGDVAVILQGDNVFGACSVGVLWKNPTPMRNDGTYYLEGGTPRFYQAA